MKFKNLLLIVFTLLAASCASVTGGAKKTMAVHTSPTAANMTVTNRSGEIVSSQMTPALIDLKRGAGFFTGEKYTFTFDKEGFEQGKVTVDATVNGLYFGNFIIGGPVGFLIDPITGAMWTFPEAIHFNMVPRK